MLGKKSITLMLTIGLMGLLLIAIPQLLAKFTTATSLPTMTSPSTGLFNRTESPTTNTVAPQPSATNTITPQPTPTYGLFGGAQIVDLIGDKTPEQVVKDLLISNGGCELPCFWGIVPGKTTLATVQEFLQPIAFNFSKVAPFQYYVSFPYLQKIKFPEDWEQTYRFHIFRTRMRPNVVEQIYVPYYGDLKLSDILREHGKPKQIHYWSNGDGIEGSKSRIILDYSNQGILFVIEIWSSLETNTEGQQFVQTCPDMVLERNVSLWLVSPSIMPGPEEITLMLSKFYRREDIYKPLSEVSNTTIDQTYSLALTESEICISSPLDYWADFGTGPTSTP